MSKEAVITGLKDRIIIHKRMLEDMKKKFKQLEISIPSVEETLGRDEKELAKLKGEKQ